MRSKFGSCGVLFIVMAFMLIAGGCGGGGDKNDGYTPPSTGGKILTVTPSILYLMPGETASLLADNIRGKLTWMSQNEFVSSVYPVDEKFARVTALMLGETDILVFDSSGAEAVCHVIVTNWTTPIPTPITPIPLPESINILNDEWDISSGANGDGTAKDSGGNVYTLQLRSGGVFKLNIAGSSASSIHAAAGGTLTGTVEINLTWDVLDTGGAVRETFTFAASGAASLEVRDDNTYWYVYGDTTLEIKVGPDGSVTVTQIGKAEGYDYEATYTAKGFLFALNGTWVGSNGHATGVIDGISGTATLVDGGTVALTVFSITGNTVTGTASVNAEWDIYAGGQYYGRQRLSGGTFGTVTLARLSAKEFRFIYQDSYGQETVDITLNSKTLGQVKQTGNYPADGVSYEGSYTVTKR
jgi:hypothetical protein